jgi:site-specific recombinase XerD
MNKNNKPICNAQLNEKWKQYLASLYAEQLSKNTIRCYQSQVRQFLQFTDENFGGPEFESIDCNIILERYCAYLSQSYGNASSSINQSLTAIAHFFRHCGVEAHILTRSKVVRSTLKVLTPAEQERLGQHLAICGSVRDRAIITLFCNTGIKLSECTALNEDDVSISAHRGYVFIKTKRTGLVRRVPLNDEVRSALLSWLIERAGSFTDNSQKALFLTVDGTRISASGLDFIVRKVGLQAGLVISAQLLRNTFLSALISSSHDVENWQQVTGFGRAGAARRYKAAQAFPFEVSSLFRAGMDFAG